MSDNDPIDIVITSYGRIGFTHSMLQSIERHTQTPHRIIVVDNFSGQEARENLVYQQEIGRIDVLVLLDKNEGLEPAKNFGLQHVRSDYYVDTDNDILVPPTSGKHGEWLSTLRKLIEDKDANLAAIAATPQVFVGANKSEMFKDAGKILVRDFVGGSLRLMHTETVRAVGGWRSDPKDMEEANRGEEHYICGKLREKGYQVAYATNIPCHHMFGEDEEWGYGELPHYHRDIHPRPTDKMYPANYKD